MGAPDSVSERLYLHMQSACAMHFTFSVKVRVRSRRRGRLNFTGSNHDESRINICPDSLKFLSSAMSLKKDEVILSLNDCSSINNPKSAEEAGDSPSTLEKK